MLSLPTHNPDQEALRNEVLRKARVREAFVSVKANLETIIKFHDDEAEIAMARRFYLDLTDKEADHG